MLCLANTLGRLSPSQRTNGGRKVEFAKENEEKMENEECEGDRANKGAEQVDRQRAGYVWPEDSLV